MATPVVLNVQRWLLSQPQCKAGSCSTVKSSCNNYTCNSAGTDCRSVCTSNSHCSSSAFCLDLDCRKWIHHTPTSQATKAFYSLWGTSSTDVWAVGGEGTIYHYDGKTWKDQSPAGLSAFHFSTIWGTSPLNIWVGGTNGALLNYNGVKWSKKTSPTTAGLISIWGTSTNDVWLVASANPTAELFHYDGATWTSSTKAPSGYSYYDIWGSSTNDVWAVGTAGSGVSAYAHYDGKTWTHTPNASLSPVYAISGTSSSDIWAAGSSKTLALYDNSKVWFAVSTGSTAILSCVRASTTFGVWAGGEGSKDLVRFSNTTWTKVPGPAMAQHIWISGKSLFFIEADAMQGSIYELQ